MNTDCCAVHFCDYSCSSPLITPSQVIGLFVFIFIGLPRKLMMNFRAMFRKGRRLILCACQQLKAIQDMVMHLQFSNLCYISHPLPWWRYALSVYRMKMLQYI